MTESIAEKKLSRRQFMGTAAAGAASLGVAAAATTLVPHVAPAAPEAPVKEVSARGAKPAAPLRAGPAPVPSDWDYSADVVVVGLGAAGAAAAITAFDAGSSVIVLEKAPWANGGNSGISGGQVFSPVLASNGGSVADFITYHKMIHWGTVDDDDLIKALCTGIAEWPSWIASLGGTTMYTTAVSAVPRSLVTGFVNPGFQSQANWENYCFCTLTGSKTAKGTGVDTMYFLIGCVNSRKIPVLLSTPAQKLIQDPSTGEILGVQAVNGASMTINVQANKGVILACGGFENNKEMLNQYLPWSHTMAPYTTFWGTPYNTGDGITMAQSVGAKLWHMNNKEWTGTGYGCKAASDQFGMGFQVSSSGATPGRAIIVNRYGRRFMNEHVYTSHTAQLLPTDQLVELNGLSAGVAPYDSEYSYLTSNPLPTAAAAQSVSTDYVDYPNVPFYLIFDSQLMKAGPLQTGGWPGVTTLLHPKGTQTYVWSTDNSAELANGWIVTGPDPATLAGEVVSRDYWGRVVGMDPKGLTATITKYNADCAAGNGDTVFGRPAASMVALNSPPYYAMELCIGSLNTNGGPVHDQYGRTIDVYNNPIPRLYTVGENGSIFGFLYHSGGNLPEAMVMGRIAGSHASGLPPVSADPS